MNTTVTTVVNRTVVTTQNVTSETTGETTQVNVTTIVPTNVTQTVTTFVNRTVQSPGLWTFTYQCNSTNDEFYLHITNKLYQANKIDAVLATAGSTAVDGQLHTYCNGASTKNCTENATTRGFSNYTALPGEMIEFYVMCTGPVTRITTLTVTAQYLYSVPVPGDIIDEGLSGGGIAGIVIACIVFVIIVVAVLVYFKGVGGLRCCKNKTQQIPDESPRAPNDIDRRETGLAGNADHHAHNSVSIQPHVSGKDGRSQAPLDELMGATSAPFPG